MKRVRFLFVILLLLSSCAPVSSSQVLPTVTSTPVPPQPTFTVVPLTATFTAAPPTATSTPEPCNPLQADYCVTDGHFVFQRPIYLPANAVIDPTYAYGSTANGVRDPHHGVEFLNKFGTPVHAAGDGIVIFAGPDKEAIYSPWPNFYGNLVVIQHADNLYTLYAHLSKINVLVSQSISVGEQIGEVGQSGTATGSHLHFEVRQGNGSDYFATENPELWLVPNPGENGQPMGAIQIVIQNTDGQLVHLAKLTLQRYDAQNLPVGLPVYNASYEKSLIHGEENAAISDLPPGKYRMAMQYYGGYQERWVEVQSGKLTQVVFLVQ